MKNHKVLDDENDPSSAEGKNNNGEWSKKRGPGFLALQKKMKLKSIRKSVTNNVKHADKVGHSNRGLTLILSVTLDFSFQ